MNPHAKNRVMVEDIASIAYHMVKKNVYVRYELIYESPLGISFSGTVILDEGDTVLSWGFNDINSFKKAYTECIERINDYDG